MRFRLRIPEWDSALQLYEMKGKLIFGCRAALSFRGLCDGHGRHGEGRPPREGKAWRKCRQAEQLASYRSGIGTSCFSLNASGCRP